MVFESMFFDTHRLFRVWNPKNKFILLIINYIYVFNKVNLNKDVFISTLKVLKTFTLR